MTQLVELQPIKPFVGSYRCSVADADVIDERLVDRDGLVVKERIPRKRFVGLISTSRVLTTEERAMADKGTLRLAEGAEVDRETGVVVQHPRERTVRVPPEIADSLVKRGLAVRVEKPKGK